ncbi:hypothetical protein [Microbulbifer agarilyticus]|uniref:hypothetical protein n=1 Tax=Microbulbifer agarilyticus TaxID=260552 RepID=UPI001C947643|nr:hypothetical protein [Microbulbifer agarilyticus]MBY6211584.1 hypothetical protein [Microbulbifer agarilyticus]MCA0893399.1 hypothetical protein [Microbulbifer agarilyticus]
MSHVYVLTNQHQQFLSKGNDWIDGREHTKLFRTEHKDVAINQMFEANTRDVSLRIELLECKLDTKRQPLVPEDALSEAPLVADDEANVDPNPETAPASDQATEAAEPAADAAAELESSAPPSEPVAGQA